LRLNCCINIGSTEQKAHVSQFSIRWPYNYGIMSLCQWGVWDQRVSLDSDSESATYDNDRRQQKEQSAPQGVMSLCGCHCFLSSGYGNPFRNPKLHPFRNRFAHASVNMWQHNSNSSGLPQCSANGNGNGNGSGTDWQTRTTKMQKIEQRASELG